MRIIDELKNHNPGIDVIIAANVIQNEAVELFKELSCVCNKAFEEFICRS